MRRFSLPFFLSILPYMYCIYAYIALDSTYVTYVCATRAYIVLYGNCVVGPAFLSPRSLRDWGKEGEKREKSGRKGKKERRKDFLFFLPHYKLRASTVCRRSSLRALCVKHGENIKGKTNSSRSRTQCSSPEPDQSKKVAIRTSAA